MNILRVDITDKKTKNIGYIIHYHTSLNEKLYKHNKYYSSRFKITKYGLDDKYVSWYFY